MKYDLKWLEQQEEPDYLFFWGHQPSKDGSIVKTCMSQWWSADFEEDGIVYKTAEHYMMCGKAKTFNDMTVFDEIVQTGSPKEVKALGRKITPFDADIWDAQRYDIVVQGNFLKFSQHEDLKGFLLGTGDKVIVEASPRDRIWGIGMGENNPNAQDVRTWRGRNLLGFALMEARDQLRDKNREAV